MLERRSPFGRCCQSPTPAQNSAPPPSKPSAASSKPLPTSSKRSAQSSTGFGGGKAVGLVDEIAELALEREGLGREDWGGEAAVRAGLRRILFALRPEAEAQAIDAYLKSLRPAPSPFLADGKSDDAAKRGRKVFERAGRAECHPPGLYTDLRSYDVGTRRGADRPNDEFDTPSLLEVWRAAPYLHDGSAATLGEVLTRRNAADKHGRTSGLSARELADLCEFIRFL